MYKIAPILFFLFCSFLSCQKNDAVPLDTYWETADPSQHGLAADSLALASQIAADLPNFYALLVVRNNRLVWEEYYKGKQRDDLFHLRSITKNITSALSGIALEQGHLPDLDAPIQPYFPDLLTGDKAQITSRHLLNMTSGLTWDEDAEIIDLIEHRIPDPIETVLARDLTDSPGSTFNYNSVSPHILTAVLETESGQAFEQYAEENLFEPLNIQRFAWNRDPNGAVWGGFGLQLRARDLAKFGQLYLNDGQWEGQQLVPSAWVQQSATQQLEIPGSSSDYSLQWWVSNTLDTPLYFGLGYGGQALMIFPEKNLLIVAFQEYFVPATESNEQWRNFRDQVMLPIYRGIE